MEDVCVAFKAHMGWVNAGAVLAAGKSLSPLPARRVDLIETEDRSVREPYHVAGGWRGLERVPRPPDPKAVIARGRKAQIAAGVKALAAFRDSLAADGFRWTRAVVLTTRGIVHDDLEEILGSHAHIHIAEGEAIRDATRKALRKLKIDPVGQDEKSVLETAAKGCGQSAAELDQAVKSLKPSSGKWAKEERVIALAAWLHRRPNR